MFNISEHFGLEWLGCCPPSWLGSSAHSPKFSHRGHRVGQSFTLHHSAQQLQFTGRRQLWLRLQPHLQDLASSLSLLDLDPFFSRNLLLFTSTATSRTSLYYLPPLPTLGPQKGCPPRWPARPRSLRHQTSQPLPATARTNQSSLCHRWLLAWRQLEAR